MPPLPDLLKSGLTLVMVGFNPGMLSWQQGHYYANPRNYFYPLMYKHGITPRLFRPDEDVLLPDSGIGMVDVLKEPSARSSDIPSKVFVSGKDALLAKLKKTNPRIVCFNGAGIYLIMFGKTCKYGLQKERIGDATVYVVPSTSPANNGKWQERERCFAELGEIFRREAQTSFQKVRSADKARPGVNSHRRSE